nr:NB-ARC domains-containing protein [Tanacetum cinerariifolium]
LIKVHTDDNLADPFTKALPRGMVIDHAKGIELQLDNWAAEELLDAGDGVEVMHANGREVLDYHKMVSLVEENTFQQCIRMLKLICLAALYNLSTNDQGILVKSGEALLWVWNFGKKINGSH